MRALILIATFGAAALAQAPGDAFTLIRIIRKPGPVVDSTPIAAHRQAKVGVDVLGLRSVTGPSQVWLVEAHGSFESVGLVDSAIAAAVDPNDRRGYENDLLAPPTSTIGILRPGLSYRPDEAIKLLPLARYYQVSIFRMRPGTDFDFAEVVRIRQFARDSINLDRPELGYQIVSGATSGTYVFLSPLQSLRTIDNSIARLPVYAEGAAREGFKAGRQIATEADIIREQLIFRVEPRISYVSDSFASPDPGFWHGRAKSE